MSLCILEGLHFHIHFEGRQCSTEGRHAFIGYSWAHEVQHPVNHWGSFGPSQYGLKKTGESLRENTWLPSYCTALRKGRIQAVLEEHKVLMLLQQQTTWAWALITKMIILNPFEGPNQSDIEGYVMICVDHGGGADQEFSRFWSK